MDAAHVLTAKPGLYRGLVTGLESGECSARIEVRRAPGGCLTVDYEAASEREGLQHREHTVVTPDALFVAFEEAAGVSVFERDRNSDLSFVCAAPGRPVLGIRAAFNSADDSLAWAWHWSEDGADPREMSRALCRLTDV